jgi:hypothetical protein
VTDDQRIRTLIAELVHLRGQYSFLLVTLQRRGVLPEEFENEFQQFWENHGSALADQYLEQLERSWAKRQGESSIDS